MAIDKRKTLESIRDFFGGMTTGQKLTIVVCLGFILRLYVALNAVTISVDSAIDLRLARAFIEGDFYGGLDASRPPLHPLLVSLLYPLFNDYEFSARIISLVFGTLVIAVSFHIGKRVFDERVGLITAILVAVHPYLIRFSGDTLREGLYYFLTATVTLLGIKAVFSRSIRFMFLVGLVCFLAYLTKHSSIGFLVVISLWVIFYNFGQIRKDWGRRLSLLASGWAVFFLMALPYLFFLFQKTGRLTITGKFSLDFVFSMAYKTVTFNNEYLVNFLKHFPEAFSFAFFVLFLWYIFKRFKEGFTSAEYYLITIVVAYSLVHLTLGPERRYFVQLMPFALVFSAMGFIYVEDWLRATKKGPLIITVLFLAIVAIQLPKGLKTLKAHRLPEKLAGEWLLATEGNGTTVISRKPIVTYYADGNFVYLIDGFSLESVVRRAKRHGAEYIAGYPEKFREVVPDFDRDEKRLLIEVRSFEGKDGKRFVLYRVKPTEKKDKNKGP
jgi:4-amino-4-deoxy-L-arabinose transferase-like glycosyltransferase